MEVYLYLLIFVGLISILNSPIQKALSFLAVLLLILLAVFRDPKVGTDTPVYLDFFDNALYLKYHLEDFKEFGFYYFFYLLRSITDERIWFLFFVSVFTYVPLMFFLKKTSINVAASLFLYIILGFYTQSFNLLRQSIAMSFVLLALYYLSCKSYRKSILFYLIASQFHITAILLIIIYPVSLIKKININFARISLLITFVIGLYLTLNPHFINNIILQNSGLVEGTSFGKFQNLSDYDVSYMSIMGYLSTTISLAIFSFYSIKINPDNFYVKYFFLGVLINNLFCAHEIFVRIPYYLTLLAIIIIPSLIKKSNYVEIWGVLIAVIVFLFLYSGFNLSAESIKYNVPNSFPYRFV